MTRTEFDKWLDEKCTWLSWAPTLTISNYASQATKSLFIAKGSSSLSQPFLNTFFQKCFDLEAGNGIETVTLVFDIYRQSWATEAVQRFLHVPCFNAFASSKPLDYFCVDS